MKLLNHLDAQRLSIVFAALHPAATAPTTPVVGQTYFDTSSNRLLSWNGATWANNATDSALLNGQNGAYYLSRANHTGTQLASTISNLAATVQAYRLDQFAAPTAAVAFNSQRITNLADGVNPQDAATMNNLTAAISNAAAGIDSKPSVRLVLIGNDTLSGLAARDGVTPVAGDRILAVGQTTASQNGVYIAAAGAWSRATDADGTGEITPGAFWFVEEGTTYGGSQWRVSTTGTITLGTTPISINQFGGGISYSASLGVQLVGSDFRAVVAPSGGLSVSGSGLAVDRSLVPNRFAATIGDGSATSIVITHNLNTKDVIAQFRLVANDEAVIVDWVATSVNSITASFAAAPAASAIRVVVIG